MIVSIEPQAERKNYSGNHIQAIYEAYDKFANVYVTMEYLRAFNKKMNFWVHGIPIEYIIYGATGDT